MDAYIEYIIHLTTWFAYLAIFLTVFAESGILIGAVLPGDSLLLTVGFLASQGYFNVWLLCGITAVGAVVGDSVGYSFGKKIGPGLFNRPSSRFFNKKQLEKARDFYDKHGVQTIVLARFVPFARTFAPILAGVGEMKYKTFLRYNVIGGVAWSFSVTLIGYFLGTIIPKDKMDRYILFIIASVIVISLIPGIREYLKNRKERD